MNDQIAMDTERLAHLPDRKRRELQHAVRILFEEFEDAQKTKLSDKARRGRILKLVLFGSYARGDWVEDRGAATCRITICWWSSTMPVLPSRTRLGEGRGAFASGAEPGRSTGDAGERDRAHLSGHERPAGAGRPFFVDIARDGIVLHELAGFPLTEPKLLTEQQQRTEATRHFEHWFANAGYCLTQATYAIGDHQPKHAAFDLHQATERLYHCALLVLTLYSPKLHRLTRLRSQAESVDARLIPAWPRDTKFARRCFALLNRAYVDARYSPHYEISDEELAWLVERVSALQETVAAICTERLAVSEHKEPNV